MPARGVHYGLINPRLPQLDRQIKIERCFVDPSFVLGFGPRLDPFDVMDEDSLGRRFLQIGEDATANDFFVPGVAPLNACGRLRAR